MKLVVDLTRCQGYAQCAFLAPSAFTMRGDEALRYEGFTGSLTVIGDEAVGPYDRPPLSKQVLEGRVPAEHTGLPRRRAIDADWRLGVAATGLDLAAKQVRLADGSSVGFDR